MDAPTAELPPSPLHPLPAQPTGVPWPQAQWPEGAPPAGVPVEALMEEAFAPGGAQAVTQAVVMVQGGRIVAERYAGHLPHFDRAPEPVGPETPMMSWSMAKSVCHAAVGILVGDGLVDPTAPAAVPQWPRDDPRRAITLDHLLAMRDGLAFSEEYEDPTSDAMRMLFGDGAADTAAFAAERPLAATPGARFHYSSGSTNIVSGVVARLVGPGDHYRRFLHQRLFGPVGMRSASPELDQAGTFVASSSLRATARDYARFGLLALRDGIWGERRILPEGWMDYGRAARSIDPDDPDGARYGTHWWAVADGLGTFSANGYEGQCIQVTPAADLVVVRLGKTPQDRTHHVADWRARVARAFAGQLSIGPS